MNDKQIILNRIQTPDGTILTSHHVHECIFYVDANGEEYMVDGGREYLRRNVNTIPYTELSVYLDDDFEKIRESFYWGTYGEEGNNPLKWVLLKDMDDSHIVNCISHLLSRGLRGSVYIYIFRKEVEYRQNE